MSCDTGLGCLGVDLSLVNPWLFYQLPVGHRGTSGVFAEKLWEGLSLSEKPQQLLVP